MKKSRWTDYERYLVLSDNSGTRLKGTYEHFQDFKRVVEVLTSMSKSQRQNVHLRDGEIVSLEGKGISTTDANTILTTTPKFFALALISMWPVKISYGKKIMKYYLNITRYDMNSKRKC